MIVAAQRVGEAAGDGGVLPLFPQGGHHELVALWPADEDEIGSTRPAQWARATRPAISVRASSVPRTRWRKRSTA
jgi:hypothetical protein